MDWVLVAFVLFKGLVFLAGMVFAIKWHYDREKMTLGRRVLLGMTAKVRFVDRDDNARLTVPLSAIFQHQGQPALWVVGADETVSLRPVSVAAYHAERAVLAGGVAAGERVVVAGVHKLTSGERVHVIDPPNPPAAGGSPSR